MTSNASPALDTLLLHADRDLNDGPSFVAPIYQTATFAADSAADFAERSSRSRHAGFYTRYQNPNSAHAERVIAELEGAEASLLTASGMAAVATTVLTFAAAGRHVVIQDSMYGGTRSFARDIAGRFGVAISSVDQCHVEAFAAAVRPETALMLLETPSNPALRLTDLAAVAALARSRGILTVVDNTFATPINQRPLDFGIDLVVHSATKYLAGHGDLSAGVVAGSTALIDRIWNTHVLLGTASSPFNAWLLLRGLRTLSLRVGRHNDNAMAIARFLADHRAVERVNYPGLESHPQRQLAGTQMRGAGGMLSFEVIGGLHGAHRVVDRLRIPRTGASLGAAASLVVCAAANVSHYMDAEEAARTGIAPGLIRMSVGLEDADDLIADLDQALSP